MADKSAVMSEQEEAEMASLMSQRRAGRSSAFYGRMEANPSRGVPAPVRPNPTVTESGICEPEETATEPLISSPRILRQSTRVKVGFASTQGRRPTMEDEIIIAGQLKGRETDYLAVFDGHGGRDAAMFASKHLHPILVEKLESGMPPQQSLSEAFLSVQMRMREESVSGGCTAIVALLIGETCYVANAGDSRAVFMQGDQVRRISTDHKPDVPSEKERITQAGGTVTQIPMARGTKIIARVNGVLSVSRALGDLTLQPYVSAEPEIQTFRLCSTETTLVLACDGLWDVVSDEEALEMTKEALNVKEAAVKLVEASLERMSMDNISVVVARMPSHQGTT